ncbi:hypothetical protein [Aliikangiella coralliicola]|uniref:Uncharacterized protein n=1 Tax=Aliikangiella coralliicola TaxID=2592383 RepID=A0A545UEZ2_9GAMM|nr:hypothetical protein [Aliikangiella coralliicola]TQV88052.1 hypothetical protein FLL46_09595 [Aliikangiella coralliicola]
MKIMKGLAIGSALILSLLFTSEAKSNETFTDTITFYNYYEVTAFCNMNAHLCHSIVQEGNKFMVEYTWSHLHDPDPGRPNPGDPVDPRRP